MTQDNRTLLLQQMLAYETTENNMLFKHVNFNNKLEHFNGIPKAEVSPIISLDI